VHPGPPVVLSVSLGGYKRRCRRTRRCRCGGACVSSSRVGASRCGRRARKRIEAQPEDHIIAHDKRPTNTNGLQKGPRPRKILAKARAGAPAHRKNPGPKAAHRRVGLYCGPPAGRPTPTSPGSTYPRRARSNALGTLSLRTLVHRAHEEGPELWARKRAGEEA
jgi:hypothetical protein